MAAYVLKRWDVSNEQNNDGNFVDISGRRPGVISWILSLIGIEATVSFAVSDSNIVHAAGSWSGIHKRIVPLRQVSSMYYGFTRPWKECLLLFVMISIIIGNLVSVALISVGTGFVIGLIGAVICFVYYALNKRLTLGIQESGAVASGVQFKRSVIEGKRLDENDARYVCDIIQALMSAG